MFGCSKRPKKWQKKRIDAQYNQEGAFFTTVDGIPVRKIYVSNMSHTTKTGNTQEMLYEYFKDYGTIIDISVVKQPSENLIAFITFSSPQEAAKALSDSTQFFEENKRLHLSPADSWHQPVELPDGNILWDRRKITSIQLQAKAIFDACQDGSIDNCSDNGTPMEILNESDEQRERGENEPEQEYDRSSIHNLNDDCLRLIFDWLPVEHRLALNRVCRRWRKINSYFWNNFKKLDFTASPLTNIALDDKKLNYFLYLCPNVVSLNIAKDDNNLTSNAIVIIAQYCKELEEIHVRNIAIQKRSLAFLANSCPRLTSFSMDACNAQHDGEMISLVRRSKNLKSISLKYGSRTTGVWLKFLQSPLSSLTLQMYDFVPEHLLEGISNVKNTLKELSFVSCSRLRNLDLRKIVNMCPSLTKLALSGMLPLFEICSSLPIDQLTQLEILDLEHNRTITDCYMDSLVEGCPVLRELNISGIGNLTQKGLLLLGKLSKLTHLRMSCLDVTDSLLKQLSRKLKLKHLDISGCKSVTDEGCIEILHSCNQLESLDLAGCDYVTNETILAAINILSNETTRKKLNIVCGNSQVTEEPWFYEPDTVKRVSIDLNSTIISTSNYKCVFHPMFDDDLLEMSDPDEFDYSDLYDEYDDHHLDFSDLSGDYDDFAVDFSL